MTDPKKLSRQQKRNKHRGVKHPKIKPYLHMYDKAKPNDTLIEITQCICCKKTCISYAFLKRIIGNKVGNDVMMIIANFIGLNYKLMYMKINSLMSVPRFGEDKISHFSLSNLTSDRVIRIGKKINSNTGRVTRRNRIFTCFGYTHFEWYHYIVERNLHYKIDKNNSFDLIRLLHIMLAKMYSLNIQFPLIVDGIAIHPSNLFNTSNISRDRVYRFMKYSRKMERIVIPNEIDKTKQKFSTRNNIELVSDITVDQHEILYAAKPVGIEFSKLQMDEQTVDYMCRRITNMAITELPKLN